MGRILAGHGDVGVLLSLQIIYSETRKSEPQHFSLLCKIVLGPSSLDLLPVIQDVLDAEIDCTDDSDKTAL